MEIQVKSRSMTRFANVLTVSRIVALPIIVWSFFIESGQAIAFWLFLLASITDWLDGKIARTFNAGSKFGQMLDPIADKLLVSVVLVMLLFDRYVNINGQLAPRADLIPVLLIICREVLVSGLREFMASEKVEMPVTRLAKWKTAIQFIAIITLLAAPVFTAYQINLQSLGQLSLWIAALLTLITGYGYLRNTLRHIRSGQ